MTDHHHSFGALAWVCLGSSIDCCVTSGLGIWDVTASIHSRIGLQSGLVLLTSWRFSIYLLLVCQRSIWDVVTIHSVLPLFSVWDVTTINQSALFWPALQAAHPALYAWFSSLLTGGLAVHSARLTLLPTSHMAAARF
jgi:hypothetical protein